MEKNKSNLKNLGIIFIIIAILDAGVLVVNCLPENFNKILNTSVEGISAELIKIIAIISLVIIGIEILIRLFLGVRAIQQGNGTSKKRGNITLAKIILVFGIIGIISSAFGLKMEVKVIIDFVFNVLTVCLLFLYISYAKKVLDE